VTLPPKPKPPHDPLDWARDELTEDLPALPEVPDDPGGDWLPDEEPWVPEALPDGPDDADDGSWTPEPEPPSELLDLGTGEPIVLGWREQATLPEHGVTVPAVLDPTRATSEWTVPTRPPVAELSVLITIGAFQATVRLSLRDGPEAQLRLGRDALAGRVLIRP
jgi:hypothetical protein